MTCQFVKKKQAWVCSRPGCRNTVPVTPHTQERPPRMACRAEQMPDAPLGPGDYLHADILRLFGEGVRGGCGCEDWIARMNTWGPAGCREHLAEIVAKLKSEADKRDWWRFAAMLPGATLAIEQLVLHAIRQAERNSNGNHQPNPN